MIIYKTVSTIKLFSNVNVLKKNLKCPYIKFLPVIRRPLCYIYQILLFCLLNNEKKCLQCTEAALEQDCSRNSSYKSIFDN